MEGLIRTKDAVKAINEKAKDLVSDGIIEVDVFEMRDMFLEILYNLPALPEEGTREWLKKLRKEKGLNQKDIADKLGVSRAAVSLWEKGNRSPKYQTIVKLISAIEEAAYEKTNTTDNPATDPAAG